MNEPKKQLTLEDLSKQVDDKMDGMSTRIDGLAKQVDDKMDGMSTRIDGLAKQVDDKMDGISGRIDGLAKQMDDKIENLSTKMDKKIEDLAIMISDGFEDQKRYLDDRLDARLKEELEPIKVKLSEMVTVDYLNKRISELNGESITRDRKLENRQSAEIEMHIQNKNITPKQRQELAGLKIFPATSHA